MAILHWQTAHRSWSFWLRWMAGTTAGLVLIVVLNVALNSAVSLVTGGSSGGPPNSAISSLLIPIGWATIGIGFGLGQSWALAKEFRGAGWWTIATLVGYPLGVLLPSFLPRIDLASMGALIPMVSFGLSLGILQWLVLRGRVEHAEWWVAISITGWLLTGAVIGAAYMSGLYIEPFDMLAAFLIPATVSGAGMALLLKHKTQGPFTIRTDSEQSPQNLVFRGGLSRRN